MDIGLVVALVVSTGLGLCLVALLPVIGVAVATVRIGAAVRAAAALVVVLVGAVVAALAVEALVDPARVLLR